MYRKLLIITAISILSFSLFAQTSPDTKGQKINLELKSPNVEKSNDTKEEDRLPIFDQYQIFLTEPTDKIEKIEYEQSGEPVEYIHDKSNNRIILEDYEGKGRLKISYTDLAGESKSFSKSSCYIDPMQEL